MTPPPDGSHSEGANGPDEFEAALDGFGHTADADRGRDDLERLATDAAERMRAGRSATADDVAAGGGDLADRLRDVLPVVAALERWKSTREVECVRGGLPAVFPVRRLGDCRLVREIGRGGNGIVFEAVQGRTSFRRVAVKVLPWRYAADGSPLRRRFREEAATLVRLRHRNVVRIDSAGEDGGFGYYVMELVEGPNFAELLTEFRGGGSMPRPLGVARGAWRSFAQVGVQVAAALTHAHGRGVLHNDVKPANLLLDPAGRVVVTDFGLAPVPEEGFAAAGTGRYMAPERFDRRCGERSDVYALGATLYELATLRPAFDGVDRVELTARIVRGDFPPPREVDVRVPVDLEAVILKAMSRDPSNRYGSAAELGADLTTFLRGRRVAAHPGRVRRLWTRLRGVIAGSRPEA